MHVPFTIVYIEDDGIFTSTACPITITITALNDYLTQLSASARTCTGKLILKHLYCFKALQTLRVVVMGVVVVVVVATIVLFLSLLIFLLKINRVAGSVTINMETTLTKTQYPLRNTIVIQQQYDIRPRSNWHCIIMGFRVIGIGYQAFGELDRRYYVRRSSGNVTIMLRVVRLL